MKFRMRIGSYNCEVTLVQDNGCYAGTLGEELVFNSRDSVTMAGFLD